SVTVAELRRRPAPREIKRSLPAGAETPGPGWTPRPAGKSARCAPRRPGGHGTASGERRLGRADRRRWGGPRRAAHRPAPPRPASASGSRSSGFREGKLQGYPPPSTGWWCRSDWHRLETWRRPPERLAVVIIAARTPGTTVGSVMPGPSGDRPRTAKQ